MFPQWNPQVSCLQIPTCRFNCCFRHAVTAHLAHQSGYIRGTLDLGAHGHRGKIGPQSLPCSTRPLFVIKWAFARGAFTPSFASVCVANSGDDHSSLKSSTKTGFEEMNKWKFDFAKFNAFDFQHYRSIKN